MTACIAGAGDIDFEGYPYHAGAWPNGQSNTPTPNYQIAAFLKVSEQQVANIRFAAVKKLSEHVKNSGLPMEVFPELTEDAKT